MTSKKKDLESATNCEAECDNSNSQSLSFVESYRLNTKLPHSLKIVLIVLFVAINLVTSILAALSGVDHTRTLNNEFISLLIGASNNTNTTV